jgi:hypothetical protein
MLAAVAAILSAILQSVLATYGKYIGKSTAEDAPTNRGLLRRGGDNVRRWLRANGASAGGRANSDRAEQ